MIIGKLLSLIAPALVLFCLAGWGWLATRAAPGLARRDAPPGLFHCAVLGMFVLSIAVMLINFVAPIGTSPGLITITIGLAAFAASQALRTQLLAMACLLLPASLIAWLLLDNFAFSWDTGGYHMQFMNFLAHEPTPLGMVRVYYSIGTNPGWLILQSAFRIEELGWAHLMFTELALRTLALGWLLHDFLTEIRQRWGARSTFLLAALLVLIPYSLHDAYTSTDAAPLLLGYLAWIRFCKLILGEPEQARSSGELHACLALIGLGLFFKLSLLPICVLLVLLAWEWRGPSLAPVLRSQRPLIALITLTLGLWGVRNVMLTGCLVFPVASSCLDLSWAMSPKETLDHYANIRDFARVRGPEYLKTAGFGPPGNWIPGWLSRFRGATEYFWLWFFLLTTPVVGYLFRRTPNAETPVVKKTLLYSVGAAAACLAFWFMTAPDLRFGWTYFGMLFACASFYLLQLIMHWDTMKPVTVPPVVLLLITALILIAATPTRRFYGISRFELPPPPTHEYPGLGPVFEPYASGQCWNHFPCSEKLNGIRIDRTGNRLRLIRPDRPSW